MNGINIREYTTDDLPACMAIFDSNVPVYFTVEEKAGFTDWLGKNDRGPYYVLTVGDIILACGGIYCEENESAAGLAWGMVDRSEHGKGYGRVLTDFRIKKMLEHYPSCDYKIETSQHTSEFYAQFGFQTTLIEKDGFSKGIDKVIMKIAAVKK